MVSAIVTTLGTLLAIVLGGFIAFYTAKSIKEPLNHLIEVAHEIGSIRRPRPDHRYPSQR